MSIDAHCDAGIRGIVTVRVWDVADLENARPGWSNLDKDTRHTLLTKPSEYPAGPIHEGTTTNMVLDGYLEGLAAAENPQPTHLALGDGTTSPSGSNTSLNNEVYRTVVGQDEGSGRDRLTSTLISQNEANGLAIREIGFTDGGLNDDWTQLTHTVLSSTDQIDEKTSNMAVTIDYTLEYRRVA